MTEKQAHEELYSLWENGEIPSNFTEDHSEYGTAIYQLMKFGFVYWDELI